MLGWSHRRFVLYDSNVEDIARDVADGCPMFPVLAREEDKTLDTVRRICRWLLREGADRDATIVAVGGGLTTDIAGFVAAIYKRGVRCVYVPTTLLAMVDAAYGGKTGVNLDGFKNMVGVFRKPDKVIIRTQYLKTLPEREYVSGAVELVKTFLVTNPTLYRKAIEAVSSRSDLSGLIRKAARTKRRIVWWDPEEKGSRRKLNLGHTYGHAIEWLQQQKGKPGRYSHGEAVAMGIVRAARLALERHKTDEAFVNGLVEDFRRCGFPTELPYPEEELKMAIDADKKSKGGRVRFVFPVRTGQVEIGKL